MEVPGILEETTDAVHDRNKWRDLAGFAIGGLIATEVLRRVIAQPPLARGWELGYWFTDHVFFDGKWLMLSAMALAPVRPNLPVKWLMPAAGLLLMVGSFLQLQDPLFLVLVGLLLGVALKSVPESEAMLMVMVIGGMCLGVPLNGFSGLMAAKANFPPGLMKPLFGATAGVGSASIAAALAGLFLLGRRLWKNRKR